MSDDRDLESLREASRRSRARAGMDRETAARREAVEDELMPAERAEPAREETMGFEVNNRADAREMELTRRSRFERDVDGIHFPERLKKAGWDYQFMTIRVMNADQSRVDESELVQWEDQGWRPCLAREYPSLAGRHAPPDSPIEMRGCRAYQRPKHLSVEASEEDYLYAEQQRVDRTRAASVGSGTGEHRGIPSDEHRGLVRVPEGVRVEAGFWKK